MLVPMQPTAHVTPGDVLHLVSVLVWVGSGALLLLRARPTKMTVVAGCALLANGISNPLVSATDGTSAALLGQMMLAVALTLGVLTFSILPDGQFRPAWLRWFVVGFGVLAGLRRGRRHSRDGARPAGRGGVLRRIRNPPRRPGPAVPA